MFDWQDSEKVRIDADPSSSAARNATTVLATQTFPSAQPEKTLVQLAAALSADLDRVAATSTATRQQVLVAALLVLVRHYAQEDEVVVALTAGGNDGASAALPMSQPALDLRIDLADDPPFRIALARVQSSMLASPNLVNNPIEVRVAVTPRSAVILEIDGSAKLCTWRAAADFDSAAHAALQRLIAQFHWLLAAIGADPDRPISRLAILPAAEREQILTEWARATSSAIPELSIPEAFTAQAARTPDILALVCGEARLTYRELDQRANQLAHALQARGIRVGDRVGICLDRSVDLIVGIIATLKTGAAYVPIDPAYPAERQAFMLADAGVALVLTQAKFLPSQAYGALPVMRLDSDWPQIAQMTATPPMLQASARDLAYVIYTSGSTGKPKGVCCDHRGVLNLLATFERLRSLPDGAPCSLWTNTSFDVSVYEMFSALLFGRTLHIVPDALRADSSAFFRWLHDHAIQSAYLPPFILTDLALWVSTPTNTLALRRVLVGVEPIAEAVLYTIANALRDVQFLNGYGPTETTICATLYSVDPLATPHRITPIGRAVANTPIYLLDPHLELAPLGAPGEMYIGGVQLARGYLNHPELTAERFIPDPFSSVAGARMYRTGDIARYLADGNIEFIGRSDNQVKLRGFRVELGEIEAVLGDHPDIKQAVAIIREDIPGDRRLVAYVVPLPGVTPAIATLHAHAQQFLPSHMVPAAIVLLAALPLTPNDKLDRRALPLPDSHAFVTEAYAAPQTPSEILIAHIWSEVLHIARIGVHDNFFLLGGHSLLATKVVARLREQLNRDVPLSALFTSPTVSELAAFVTTLSPDAPAPLTRIAPIHSDRPLPLSPAQERLWFFDQMEPNSGLYHVPIAVRLRRAVDPALLRESVAALVQRHESLRTTFRATANGTVQLIAPRADVPLTEVDLRGMPAAAQDMALQNQVAEAQTPFDITTGPLVRLTLICLAEQEYVLIIVQHHIITDDWSVDIVLRDLLAIYDALRIQQPVVLPELPIKYTDYALWHRAWLQSEACASQVAYWKEHLAGAPAVLKLPTDHPRPPELTYHGARHSFTVAMPLMDQVQSLSRQEGVTPYMTLLATFATLLMRTSRQTDFVVGTVVAGRTTPEVEAVVGFFVNTLPLHVDLTGDPTFRDLLMRIRAIALGAFANQDVPFERIVDAVNPDRDLSYHPIIQAMFVLQNTALGSLETESGELQVVELASSTSQFDLTLELTETHQGLRGTFRYNIDLFEAVTVQRLADHFTRLLAGIVATPHHLLSQLPMLSDTELHTLLVSRNATNLDVAAEPFVPHAFERHVARDPAALAVCDANQRLTYAEVNRRANQLAHQLLQLGVGPEDLVAVCLNRSPAMIVALLGILKAGCAYVPLDPAYPAERRAYILADARATVLIAEPALVADLPPGAYRLLVPADAALLAMPASDPVVPIFADNLAYVIYTSGSTGKPKGVQITHGNLRNLVTWYRQALHLTPQDHLSQLASPGFDATVMEIWPCLTSGANLHIADEDARIEATHLRDWLVTHRVTVSMVTTALAEQVVLLNWPEHTPLRALLTGADALRVYPPANFPAAFINNYGPTEGTVLVVSGPIMPNATPEMPPVLGRQIANTRLYLLDDSMQPVPDGVEGELYIGGAQVARGYGGRPDLTAERFVPDPFGPEPGARLYRTGDLCRYLPDGTIAFVGRTDHQIKIRGFRIEQGEIEATICEFPAVSQALVVVQADAASGDKRLVAYVVAQTAGATDADAVRAFLQDRLPGYMVPAALVMLDELPLTPNGKVDRNALPLPAWHLQESYVAPRSELEDSIAQIWADVLRVERVGVDDNFFTLGGHSLLATEVIAHLRTVVQRTVPLRAVFTYPTVAELAGYVATLALASPTPTERFNVVRRDRPLPLSSAQERLWFFDQLEPDSTLYLVPVAVRLKRPLDLNVLEQSLQALVQRHESLRTAFVSSATGPVQVILPNLTVAMPVYDLRQVAADERAAAVRQHILDQTRSPLPLEQAPLLRVVALRLADDETLVLLTQHHIITDGWSIQVLLQEWFTIYDAWTNNRPVTLPELAVQYADYGLWQRQWLQGAQCDDHITYWKNQLADVPVVLELPTDHPRPARQTYRGATYSFAVNAELAEQVQLVSRQAGATLFMTLLAAFETLLMRYSGQTEFCVGSAFAGRTQPELEGILGFFVNTLPLRADLSANPTFRELLAQTSQVVIAAQAHQDVPLDVVVEAVRPERDASRHPLFQVLFTVQQPGVAEQQIAGLSVESLDWQSTTAKFDLTLEMTPAADGFHGILEYSTELFDLATMERMMRHFTRLLEGIVADLDQHLVALPLLTAAERQQLLVDWTATARDYPHDTSLQRLFEAQVAQSPDAVAVISGTTTMSYADLNQRANRLARYLLANGAHVGARIGVCMERSCDFVVSVLAIVKIGGAYVPLDSTYPRERLTFMITDTQTPLILTQASLRHTLPDSAANVVSCDGIQAELAHLDAANLTTDGAGASAAYVMYTSGSTGQPKGVVIPHRAVARLVLNTDYISLTPADRIAHISNISFDAATFEIWGALLNGAGLVVIPRDVVITFDEFAAVLRDQHCSAMFMTTALFNQVAATAPAIFSSMQTVMVGGDAVDPQWVRQVLTVAPPQRLLNAYGPTENTTFSTWYAITNIAENATSIPIGRAIANTTTYVLDRELQPVPIGVPGELYLGGDGLALEYLHRPELTKERFVPNPFCGEPGMRLYKTGDVVRYLPDGALEFLGRSDQQVKLRGFRIELGEIEAVLNQHPQVSACHVMVREDVPGNKYVAAYVVLNPAAELTSGDLRQFLQARLPAYMMPAAFSLLDKLPLTPNGKLDRRALPPPDLTDMVADSYSAPSTELEQQLAAIWAEILHVRRVGIHDNFFDLGGHSLLGTRLISQIREECQIEVPLRILFEQATIAGLAEYITQSSAQEALPTASHQIAAVNRSADDLTDLLGMLDGLSDDEVRRLLDNEAATD